MWRQTAFSILQLLTKQKITSDNGFTQENPRFVAVGDVRAHHYTTHKKIDLLRPLTLSARVFRLSQMVWLTIRKIIYIQFVKNYALWFFFRHIRNTFSLRLRLFSLLYRRQIKSMNMKYREP